METISLCEPEELSLFGGEQLLMGLGSPLEPDSPVSFPDVRDNTNHSDQLGWTQDAYDLHKSVDTSFMVPNTSIHDESTGLEYGWMDTRLDLFDLLQDSKPDVLDISSFDTRSDAIMVPATNVVPSISEVEPTSIEDLFNQMSRSLEPAEHLETTAVDENDLLSEVLTKLKRYIDQDADVASMPDLGNGVLTPMSVTDIESLLSDSDNLVEVSPNDSGLESLLSSRPESPCPSMHNLPDPDYVSSEKLSGQCKKKSARSTPYGMLPRDRKERKKVQNKTAALKYRQKKKDECQEVTTVVDDLEIRNKELKDKVDSMTREIQYLKDLMAEVLKAKEH